MTEEMLENGPRRSRALVLLGILLVALIGGYVLRDYIDIETLRDKRALLLELRDQNYLAAAGGFVLLYALMVGFSLPGATVATLTGGFLFGLFPGVLYNVAGAGLGATGLFLAARWGLGERLAAGMTASQGRVRRIKAGIDENQWSMLFLLRLVPAVPFFVANLLPALVGVRLVPFVVTTFMGIIPGALILTSVGAGLGDLFERGEMPDLSLIFEPRFLFPILGLCLLAALPVIFKLARGGRAL